MEAFGEFNLFRREQSTKQEASVLVEELHRISAENRQLTEMLTVICENYSSMQNQFMELMKLERRKRKAEVTADDCTDNMIGVRGRPESSSRNDESRKRLKESIKASIPRIPVSTSSSPISPILRDGDQWQIDGQKVTRDNLLDYFNKKYSK